MLQRLVRTLKHIFIPHEGNDYKPHFFRELAVAILLIIGIFLLGVSAGSSFFLRKTVLGASITADVLVDLANDSRITYNAPPLTRNLLLDKAAELKGEDMSTRGYFAHESPDGVTPWHWFKEVGYVFLYAGENLAVNFTDANDVETAWLNSPKHRENLLNANFKEIGMATIEGTYKNAPTIFVVQMFGTPAKAVAQTASTSIVLVSTSSLANIPPSQTSLTASQGSGEVKGETAAPQKKPTVQSLPAQATSTSQATTTPTLIKIVDTPELAVVKSVDPLRETPITQDYVTYAPWYGRVLFGGSDYIDTIYKMLLFLTLVALLIMILVEFKRQHYKHISYGVLVAMAFVILIYINKVFIN